MGIILLNMARPDTYQLTEEEADYLKEAWCQSARLTSEAIEPWIALSSDMLAGRDPATGGSMSPLLVNPDPEKVTLDLSGLGLSDPNAPGDIRIPKTGANLILSRLRQRVTATTPGVPRLQTTPLLDGAVQLAESQQDLMDAIIPGTNLEQVMERVAFLLPTQPYFGVRLLMNPDEEVPSRRLGFEVVESTHCGYEPHLRRFTWHTSLVQFGSLPKDIREAATADVSPDQQPSPWDLVGVTEVYHPGMAFESNKHTGREVPTSIFVNLEGDIWYRRRRNPNLGKYVKTRILRAPVMVLAAGLDAPPGEDIPMPEVLSWLPLMRSIGIVIDMIMSEVQNTNNTVLYDRTALNKAIKGILNARPGQQVFLPVDVDDGDTRGVNATMRPVERNSTLPDLIATLNLLLALFDDVSGVGPLDRGAAVNPEKSATEASALVQAAGRRNTDAIRVQARLWSQASTLIMLHQRALFGEELAIPQSGGIIKRLNVPDPEVMPMNLRVDPVAFENQGRQGKLDTEMLVLTTLSNVAANFQNPNAMRMVNEVLRRFLKAAGWKDGDDYMETVGDPISRYVEFLETGRDIPVHQDDNHAAYISGYQKIIDRALADGARDIDVSVIRAALERHQMLHNEAQNATRLSPVPGVSPEGNIDNQIAAAAATGALPAMTRQVLG